MNHPGTPESAPLSIGLRLPNLMSLTRPVREIITASLLERGYDEESIDEIALVATEVVNNSFEHASEEVLHEVVIDMEIDSQKWVMTVRDVGRGRLRQEDFEFDGKGPPGHFGDRGRGTFLIWSFTDEVTVRDVPEGGTEVKIVKFRESGS